MIAPIAMLSAYDTEDALGTAVREYLGPSARLESWSQRPLSEHGKHPVARYDLRALPVGASRSRPCRWVGKLFASDLDARREASTLRRLWPADREGRHSLVIPRLISYVPRHRLLLMSYEPGGSIVSAIARGPERALRVIGRAFAALHAAPVVCDAVLSADAALSDLRQRIPELCTKVPAEAAFLEDLLATLKRRKPWGPIRSAFLHGDLGPIHMVWRAGHVVVLDFEKSGRGDAALDLGYFLAQLRRFSLRKPGRLPDFPGLRGATLDAYRRWAAPDPALSERVRWYESVTLLRKIHYLACNWTRHPDHETIRRHWAEALRLLEHLPRVLELHAGQA